MGVFKADVGELEAILYVINESNRRAYRGIIPPEYFRDPVLTLEELKREFEKMTFYVYKKNHKVVGVAALQVEKSKVGRVRWVYVLPEFQRKGIGTSLIRRVEEEAKRIELKRLWLLVADGAHWALNFYRKLGYHVVDRVRTSRGFDLILEKRLIPAFNDDF